PAPLLLEHDRGAHANYVNKGQWNQETPTEPHQLVEAIPGKREPDPEKGVEIRHHLGHEPESAVNPLHHRGWREQCRSHRSGEQQAKSANRRHHQLLDLYRLARREPETVQAYAQENERRERVEQFNRGAEKMIVETGERT